MIPKFRVWDERDKKMYFHSDLMHWDFDYLPFREKRKWLWCATKKADRIILHDRNAVLMQSTGHNDKNCNEMFEGDILFNGERIKAVVVFKHGRFFAEGKDGSMCWDIASLSQYTPEPYVIGNIYENKELFKKRVHKKEGA